MRKRLLVIFYFVVFLFISLIVFSFSSDKVGRNPRSRLIAPIDVEPSSGHEGEHQAIIVDGDQGLSPEVGEGFVISFLFKVSVMPVYNRRQRLITKYDPINPPYPGFAIALRHLPTSTRFEIYLKDTEDNGGWYTFDDFPLLVGRTYAVTFVLEPSTFVSGYAVEILPSHDHSKRTELHSLGGISIKGLYNLRTTEPLRITSGRPSIGPFVGAVKELSIFRLPSVPTEKIFLPKIQMGPRTLLENYSQYCVISIGPNSDKCKLSHQNESQQVLE